MTPSRAGRINTGSTGWIRRHGRGTGTTPRVVVWPAIEGLRAPCNHQIMGKRTTKTTLIFPERGRGTVWAVIILAESWRQSVAVPGLGNCKRGCVLLFSVDERGCQLCLRSHDSQLGLENLYVGRQIISGSGTETHRGKAYVYYSWVLPELF